MEWLREFQWLGWVAAALILGLIEVASLDLVFVMLTIAALGAASVALAGGSLVVQVLVFVGISALLLIVVRPIALRKLRPAAATELTNVAAYIGRQGEILEITTNRTGLVKVIGEDWSARSVDPERTFQVGDIVRVVRIDGATAVVDADHDEFTPPSEEAPNA
ncbi:MAG: NfeD family protein [Gulosibacter sp.]|uniref:NfeD family protein n=1 Tax=Gulosibacter sp. TaxID=2817531 RepID=UPI003F91292A